MHNDKREAPARSHEVEFSLGGPLELESRSAEGQTYRLGRRLKAGSTGDVFETSHPLLAGACAIKIFRPELTDRPEAVEALRADLDAVAALRHPNIVHIIEVGSHPGVPPFVVMELLDGRLLAEQLAGHRTVPLAQAVEIVKALAAALHAAHTRGVVHGEVNPGNVFLARAEGYDRGVVKLLNFGLHRLRRVDTLGQLPAQVTRYLSPEQASGRGDVDARADQFALAALTYRILAGTDSFPGESPLSLLYQIVHDAPALERPPDVSNEVEAVIRRALAKDKWDRFDSVLAFARAFESAAQGAAETPAAQPQPAAAPIRAIPFQPGSVLGASVRGAASTRGVDPGAMTIRGFASSRSTGDRAVTSPGDVTLAGRASRGGDAQWSSDARAAWNTDPPRPREAPLPREAPRPREAPPRHVEIPRVAAPVQARSAPRHPEPPQPARQEPAPAARMASRQGRPVFRLSTARNQVPDRADSLLMHPFFAAYPDGHAKADSLIFDEDFERPPRHGWKLVLFVIAVAIASVAASLAVGWRPPLAWRQSTVWRELDLPGAAAPSLPAVDIPAGR
jgi:hypothetical protein